MNLVKKLFVADMYAHDKEHSMVNHALIEYLSDSSNSVFLLNSHHAKFCNESKGCNTYLINDEIIKSRLLRIINREVFKTVQFVLLMFWYVFQRRRIVLLGASNIQYFVMGLIVFVTRLNISIVVHGQAEALISRTKTYPQYLFLVGFRLMMLSNCNFLYLSKHIQASKIFKKGASFYISHPIHTSYLRNKKNKSTQLQLPNHKIKAAVVGLIRNDKKNCNSIYDILTNNGIVSLYVVGRCHRDFVINTSSGVNFRVWDKMYTNEEFVSAVNDIDIFLYFFGRDQYKLTASATVLDAVLHGKSVFALKNEAIRSVMIDYPYYFEFDNLEDMAKGLDGFDRVLVNVDLVDRFCEKYLLRNNIDSMDTIEHWLGDK